MGKEKPLTTDEKLDSILRILTAVSNNQLELSKKIENLASRIYDLEVSILACNGHQIPADNPIKLRLANARKP